jgi:hypothetical protein
MQAQTGKHQPKQKNVKSNKMDQGKLAQKTHSFHKGRSG